MAFGVSAAAYSAVAAVAAAGYGAYSGERAASAQRHSLINQKKAQGTAEAQAIDQQRKADMELRRANQRQPDVTAMLASAYASNRKSQSLLTGPGGIDPNQLSLGRPKLLGQ